MRILKITAVLFFVLLLNSPVQADHHEHGAHQHGAATLGIAFEGVQGKVEFKGAAEGILGFEHTPKSAKDKKTLSDATAQFESSIAKMVAMDPKLGCEFSTDRVGLFKEAPMEEHHAGHDKPKKDHKVHGEHSDFVANFNVKCAKSPLGTKLTVDFSSFKGIRDLDITVLIGTIQKSAEFNKKPVVIELQ